MNKKILGGSSAIFGLIYFIFSLWWTATAIGSTTAINQFRDVHMFMGYFAIPVGFIMMLLGLGVYFDD